MDSLERVLATCNHKEPDRIPFDLGSSLVTGITKGAYERLAAAMGIEVGETVLYDTIQQLAEALLDRFVNLKIGFYEAAAERLGPYIQFIREGDDMAGQEALLMSPVMYRTYMKPRHCSGVPGRPIIGLV